MRLSDLLGARVVDGEGRQLGHVKDVRLVQDGPYVEGFGHQLRVDALLVGTRPSGVRLGFGRGEVRRPRLLAAVFGLLDRQAREIPWDRAALSEGDGGTVEITTV
jgi:hypothetical protein